MSIRFLIFMSIALLVNGCTSFGHRNIARDQFNYNEAVKQSHDQQMLLNIVRIRYIEMPDFLTVSSIITSYSYDSNLGVSASIASNPVHQTFTGNGNMQYAERPTITYTPLAGQDFAQLLLKPISVDRIFALGQAGWPMDLLMAIGLQHINNVKNMGFTLFPAPGVIDPDRQYRAELRNLSEFSRILHLMIVLSDKGILEVQKRNDGKKEYSQFDLTSSSDPESQQLIAEFKKTLGLDPKQNVFRIVTRTTERQPDEISIQSRSLLSMLSFLSKGVEVPDADKRAGKVVILPADIRKSIAAYGVLKVRSQKEQPEDPYVSVQYRGTWFYIDNTDIISKRTFSTLQILFQIQAPSNGATAPLLTLPAG